MIVECEHRWVDTTTYADGPNRVQECVNGCGRKRVTVPQCPDED